MTRKEAIAELLRDGLADLIDRLNRIGLPDTTGNDQWRATIVLRNVDNDKATILFGQDDEATIIVAMQTLGASKGRRQYNAGPTGLREEQP